MLKIDETIKAIQDLFVQDKYDAKRNEIEYQIDKKFLAKWVGLIAVGLPIILLASTTTGCFYDSISHFYYSQYLSGVFVGSLFFIGTFLIAYRGESDLENLLAGTAGLAAYAVAFFPTSNAGCVDKEFSARIFTDMKIDSVTGTLNIVVPETTEAFSMFPYAMQVHFVAAAVLFLFLAFYCFFIFTRKKKTHYDQNGHLTPAKARRDRFYKGCGWVILTCILALFYHAALDSGTWWNDYNLTFWCEFIALVAFGFSWLIKGRIFGEAIMDQDEIEMMKTLNQSQS